MYQDLLLLSRTHATPHSGRSISPLEKLWQREEEAEKGGVVLQHGNSDSEEQSDNISEETLSDDNDLPTARWH